MKIETVELWRVAVPLRGTRPVFHWPASHGRKPDRFYPSWIPGLPQTEMRLYLLRLIADNGLDGIAAIPLMGTERDSLGPMLGTYLIALPTAPGLGVAVDLDKVKRYGTRLHRATPLRVALSAIKDRGLTVALEIGRRKSRRGGAALSREAP